jgi:hypothetical protein
LPIPRQDIRDLILLGNLAGVRGALARSAVACHFFAADGAQVTIRFACWHWRTGLGARKMLLLLKAGGHPTQTR